MTKCFFLDAVISAERLHQSLLFCRVGAGLTQIFLLFQFLFFDFCLRFRITGKFRLPLYILICKRIIFVFIPGNHPPHRCQPEK